MDEHALVVEDDPSLREIAVMVLERAGLRVTAESDGRQALLRFQQERFDIVILDLMLPSLDGFDVCREIRKHSTLPIVMVTARTEISDLVAGLELGADDYITKPFEGAELVARVRAVLRRAAGSPLVTALSVGRLTVDPEAYTATLDGRELTLTSTEFRLLVELMRHRGQVLTRDVLLERVWSYDYLGDSRLVDMAVRRLRDKLGDDPRRPTWIATVRAVGYRFDGDRSEED